MTEQNPLINGTGDGHDWHDAARRIHERIDRLETRAHLLAINVLRALLLGELGVIVYLLTKGTPWNPV